MAAGPKARSGETEAHARLKRRALIWAQAHGYSACALEVGLPHCRYRASPPSASIARAIAAPFSNANNPTRICAGTIATARWLTNNCAR